MSAIFKRIVIPAMAIAVTCFSLPDALRAEDSRVSARYNIAFNGLSIGAFRFNSSWNAHSYELRAGARISLLNGMLFEWTARTESSGRLTTNGPRPDRYSFGYESGDDAGSVLMRFNGSRVRDVNIDPPPKKKKRVPIEHHHMESVIDPLSAVIGLSQFRRGVSGRRSCNEQLEIFDGKMRYDLTFRYKATRQVNSAGYKGPAYVCRVKFQPIAGHKPSKEETGFLEDTNDIEVWLIPVRKAQLFVPYYIYLPLPVGSASMTTEEFRLDSAREGPLTVIGSS